MLELGKIVLILLLMKAIINIYRWNRMSYLLRLYTDWVAGKEKPESIIQKKQQVIQLWKDAGLVSGGIPVIEQVEFNKLRTMTVDIFINFPQKHNPDIVVATARFFHEAIGVYKKRLINTINPFEWIIFLTKMPEIVLNSAGIKPQKWLTYILNFIWWIIAGLLTILMNSYSEQLIKLFEKLIGVK
ncbi:MAG: hypothetical protein CVV52_00385 [Spirochaetae bacterium HGW-Spirochaetae-8]|nr:MAG: hypothetical protein CVV52_00385 [Spirochaetae bacterium HGW-Spirochaetae-8]